MTMPGEVKANCRTEIANKSSDSNDFECQVNMVAAPLLSATNLSSSSSTRAQPPADLPPDKSLTENSSISSVALKTASISKRAPTYIHAATNPHSPNGLYILHQTDCGNSMGSINPTPSSSSSPSASSTSAKRASDGENIKKLFLTTSSSRSSQSASGPVTDTESANQVKFVGYENSLNYDRGKEILLEEVAEIADEVCGEKRGENRYENFEVVKDVCNDKHKSCDENANLDAVSNSRISGSEEQKVLGCVHYKRRAMFVTPCCNKFYKCRYCHDENEDHHFDRKTLTELICSECDTRQRVQETCENCEVRFGKYTCLICNLFDDEDKAQYHCYGCGICRIGGRKNFFHCEVCNMCLPIQLKIEGHRCVENISRSNCPVCLGDIHTSRIPCHIPDCGHLLHKMCFDQLLASGHYVCPTCQTSIIDMTQMWEYLDAQALIMPVPKTYEDRYVNIFCNDCHKTSTVKFHFIGLKCFHCGGYNTTQDMKRRRSWVTVNDQFADKASSA